MASYTKNTLVNRERILYMGKLHNFSYVPSVFILLVGLVIFGVIPRIPDEVMDYEPIANTMKDVDEISDKLSKDLSGAIDKFSKDVSNETAITRRLTEKLKSSKTSVPKDVSEYGALAASLRTSYMGLIFIFLGSVTFLKTYIKKKTDEYAVTNRKILYKYGFISIDSVEIPLHRIEGIKIKQTFFDRLIKRGDVIVNGIGMEQIEMHQLYDPMKFRQHALNAIERYTNTKTD